MRSGRSSPTQLQQLIDDAPDTVADDWQKLREPGRVRDDGGDVDLSVALERVGGVAGDRQRRRDECDLPIELPNLPTV